MLELVREFSRATDIDVEFVFSSSSHPHSVSAKELALGFASSKSFISPLEVIEELKRDDSQLQDALVVVAGSLFLLGDFMRFFSLKP